MSHFFYFNNLYYSILFHNKLIITILKLNLMNSNAINNLFDQILYLIMNIFINYFQSECTFLGLEKITQALITNKDRNFVDRYYIEINIVDQYYIEKGSN